MSGPGLSRRRAASWTGCSRRRSGLHMKAAGMTATARMILPPGCARLGYCVMCDQRKDIRQTRHPAEPGRPPARRVEGAGSRRNRRPAGGDPAGPGCGEGTCGTGSRASTHQRIRARTRGGSSARTGGRSRAMIPPNLSQKILADYAPDDDAIIVFKHREDVSPKLHDDPARGHVIP